MLKGRCMKCKDQKEMKDIKLSKTKRGTFMAKGKCKSCDTTVCKIMSKDQAEDYKNKK